MGKVILQLMTTLDGYIAGPNGEVDWHNVDAEFNEYVVDTMNQTDYLLFGRVTYELMASYWPTEQAKTRDPVTAGYMNDLPKIVVSRSLHSVEWANTALVRDNAREEILKLKRQPGKDIVMLGSSTLALSLMDVIDEHRVFINPIALGNGKPIFAGIREKLDFELIKTRPYRSGNVLLVYRNGKAYR